MKKFFNVPVFLAAFTFLFFLLTVLLAVTTLTSCENFLHGEQVKQDLIDYIAYCNAKECTLYISQDSSTGVFLSSAKQKCRVGYTTELQVTVNTSNYVFKTLDAVSINDLNISFFAREKTITKDDVSTNFYNTFSFR